jgi:hypothetical protein
MERIAIKKLRPTQATHGRREVEKKAADYATLAGRELEMAIAERPIPIVGGEAFAIDHRHVAAALWATGVAKVPAVLVADFGT